MARYYTCYLTPTAFTTAFDPFEFSPADDKPIEVMAWSLYQSTELGDAQEEQLPVTWVKGHTSSGSGGSAYTPVPVDSDDVAAGFACEVGNTTPASGGTTTTSRANGWNVRGPIDRPFTPEERIKATQVNTTLVMRIAGTPADSITVGGWVLIKEGT